MTGSTKFDDGRLFVDGAFRKAQKVEPVIESATGVARAIRTGTIGVNDYQLDLQAPFGGVTASGMGRELGPEGLAGYQTLKSIYRVGPAE